MLKYIFSEENYFYNTNLMDQILTADNLRDLRKPVDRSK